MKTFRKYSENIRHADDCVYEDIELNEGAIANLSKLALLGKIRNIAKQVERIKVGTNDQDEDVRKKIIDQNQLLGKGLFWIGTLMVATVVGLTVRK